MKTNIRLIGLLLAALLLLPACGPAPAPVSPTESDGTSAPVPDTVANDGTESVPSEAETDEQTEAETTPEEETEMAAELKSLMQSLDNTPFAAPVGTDACALTGPVGVEQGRMETEVLYPAPADEDCAKVIHFADYGMDASKTGAENFAAFTAGMEQFKGVDGTKKAVFPSGEIRLSQTMPFGGYHDLYMVGDNTTIVMEVWSSMSYSRDDDGLHFNDLSLNYLYSPIVWGTIAGYDVAGGSITVAVDKSFDMTNPIYGMNEGGTHKLTGYYELTEQNGAYRILPSKTIRYGAGDSCRLHDAADNTVDVLFVGGALSVEPTVGDRVNLLFCQYDACALNFTFCKNVYLEHFTMSDTTGMGLVVTYSENAFVNHLDVLPDESRGLTMATCADGIHIIRLAGEFRLTNSRLIGTQDDCLNVCTTYDRVASVEGNTLTFTPVGETTAIAAGHTIEIYDPAAWTLCGTYTVTAVDGTTLTLDKDAAESIRPEFVIGNVSTATKLTVDNCLFADSMGRGGLIQSRDTVISHCAFMNLVYPGLRVHAVNDQFKEGIVPADVTVRDCKFVNGNLFPFYDSLIEVMAYDQNTGLSSKGAIRRVTIENNYFSHSAGNAISLKGVGDASVRHNLICDMLNDPLYNSRVTIGGMMMNAAVGISYTANTVVSDNFIYSPETYSEYTDVFCDSVTTENITVENNVSVIEKHGIFNSLFMDFSDEQGKGNFTYMKRSEKGQMKKIAWSKTDNRWQDSGAFNIIARGTMHPDKMDTALVYTVPQAGTWTYSYSIQPVDSRSDGVGVAVLVNGEPVVTGENGYVYVQPLYVQKQTLTLELKEGDEIMLLLNRWKSNGFDSCNAKVSARLD